MIAIEFLMLIASESNTQMLKRIWDNCMWTFNAREISPLSFELMAFFLWTGCAPESVASWLWIEFRTSRYQIPLLISRWIVQEKEHSIFLLSVCLCPRSEGSADFFSRSHINQVFLLSPSLDFFVRSKTTAYLWIATCSLTFDIKSSKVSKAWPFVGGAKPPEEKDMMMNESKIFSQLENFEMQEKFWMANPV